MFNFDIFFFKTVLMQGSRRGKISGSTWIPFVSKSAQALIMESWVDISLSREIVLASVLQASMAD